MDWQQVGSRVKTDKPGPQERPLTAAEKAENESGQFFTTPSTLHHPVLMFLGVYPNDVEISIHQKSVLEYLHQLINNCKAVRISLNWQMHTGISRQENL